MINFQDQTFNCPYCEAKKITFDIVSRGKVDKHVSDKKNLELEHVLVCCRGCSKTSYFQFLVDTDFRGNVSIRLAQAFQYPYDEVELPEYIPENIRRFFKEAVVGFGLGLLNSSSAMCRRTIYEICDKKNVTGKDYKEKIKNLGLDKRITDPLLNIKDIGDDGMHNKCWDSLTIEKAIKALRLIIDYLYIAEEHIKDFSKQYTKEKMMRNKAGKID